MLSVVHAQQVGAIHGVVNNIDNEMLPNASILLNNDSVGTITDEQGQFKFVNMPAGKYTLEVKMVGYEPLREVVALKPNDTLQFVAELRPSSVLLDEVLLDAQTGLTRRTPYAVSSVEMQTLSKSGNPGGIAGALREIPGVSSADMGPAIVKPFIRGLGFSRIVTLYQNNKLENHQWGQDHGLGLNNLGVRSVDVIKGPASILYGSGAIGGVILVRDDESYLSTRKVTGSVGSAYNSMSNGIRSFGSIGNRFDNDMFLAVDAAYENHADYRAGDGVLIGNSRFNNHTFRIHTGIDKERFKNKFSFTYHNQDLGIIDDDEMLEGESLATTRNDRKMQLPFQQIRDYLASYSQQTFHENFNTYLHISHHFNDRNELEDDFDEIDLGLKQRHTFYSGRLTLFPDQDLSHTFGLQGSFIETENKPVAEEILIPDAKTTDFGAYYLGNLTLDNFYLQGGLRFDYRQVNADASAPALVEYGFTLPGDPEDRKLRTEFSGLTGSFGATYMLATNHQFKVNFSTGFRAPDLAELYSNGPHPGTNRFEMGNSQFDREQSIQTDLSYSYSTPIWDIGASVYFNSISNYIFFAATGETRPEDGLEIWRFEQEDASLYGTEWSIAYKPFESNMLKLSSTGSLVRGELRTNDDNLTFIPADRYNFQVAHQPTYSPRTNMFVELSLTDEQNRPGLNELRTPGYTLLNAGLQHEFALTSGVLTASANINNMFDVQYLDHLSILRAFSVPNPGRNISLAVGYRF